MRIKWTYVTYTNYKLIIPEKLKGYKIEEIFSPNAKPHRKYVSGFLQARLNLSSKLQRTE